MAIATTTGGGAQSAIPVSSDRWIEMDLYWFDPQAIDKSAADFWDRYAPLYHGLSGYKGVTISIGLTVNYVMTFTGELDQPIALPATSGQELGGDIVGMLPGNTLTRQQLWRMRFRNAGRTNAKISYGNWTYRDLKHLADALRIEGARHGVREFKVATATVAMESAYGELSPFAKAHPEAWNRWGKRVEQGFADSNAYFDPAASLHADHNVLAAFPEGIHAGTPVHAAFARQWGALSRIVGLDGIMLRDGFGFPRAYTRLGPFGMALRDPGKAVVITDAMSAMLREMKAANPAALTMMWSTAATATADWRANGLDLERLAREGNLDIFVDQTWAGAWGEVGVRRMSYWNAPILGWTYQLGSMLEHAATLAGTRVRHYHLVETFDAWESWDVIHTAPGRLRWGIWAYSHAAVKRPDRLEMPAGAYISWGHHGRTLLKPSDVTFLGETLNAAERDAAQVSDVHGPTIVYSRAAMARQVERIAPDFDGRDQTDEQIGSIIKWPLPVLSSTRMEWVPRVKSDLFVFGATLGAPPDQVAAVTALAWRGQPMAFFGAPDLTTDKAFIRLASARVAPHDPPREDAMLRAVRGDAPALAVTNAPEDFEAPPGPIRLIAAPGTTVYGFGDSAALVLRFDTELNVSLWDPAALADFWFRPLRDMMYGNPAPFVLASATLTRQLAADDRLRADSTDLQQTGTIAGWALHDGSEVLLAGNLEEGLRDDADQSRTIAVHIPAGPKSRWRSEWQGAMSENGSSIILTLPAQASMLLRTLPRRQ